MFVFISYPKKELGVFANHLAEELKDRKIDYFLDEEKIGSEDWNRKVRENIKKANAYVVLYLPEANIQNRYFHEELKKIKENSVGNDKKTTIPVTFSPNSADDLPSFLSRYNAIETNNTSVNLSTSWVKRIWIRYNAIETNNTGVKQSDNDGFWIRQIVDKIEDSGAIKLFKLKKNIFIASQIIAALLVIFLMFSEISEKKNIQTELKAEKVKVEEKQKQVIELERLRTGEYVCNLLIGKYKLDHPYTFIEKNGYRTVGNVDSTWETDKECEYDKHNNQYILKGKDTTYFDVEAFINKGYVTIATVKQEYLSEVFIDREGRLLNRKFYSTEYPPNEKNIIDIKNNNIVKLTDKQIIEKAKEVMGYRNEEHKKLETKGCYPLQGVKGGKIAVAFVCAHYTRVMEKK